MVNVQAAPVEVVLERGLPIVDAHHHLFLLPGSVLKAMGRHDNIVARQLLRIFRRHKRYLFEEFLLDLASGHNVRASVHVDAEAMYRTSGPDAMRSVGEVEFVNGVSAMSASGLFGEAKVCAGIVGGIDLRLGDAVEDVLSAHICAGGGRYRGVRCGALSAYDEDGRILGSGVPSLLLDSKFRVGFKWLHKLGLSFDVWVLEPQLQEVVSLARAFPETQIILNHLGGPVAIGRYAGKRAERFPIWRRRIRALATCPNVAVKLGGLGMPLLGFKSFMSKSHVTSAQLATDWKPYIETCVEAFGVERCMFESNYPVDAGTCSYRTLWNAFKRVTAGASKQEKIALFSGTATRVYRLELS